LHAIEYCMKPGTLDTTFILKGWFYDPEAIFNNINAIDVFSDGRILVGGQLQYYRDFEYTTLACINPDGSPNYSYNIDKEMEDVDVVLALKVLPDDSVLVGNIFSNFENKKRECIIKLKPDGSIDDSFNVSMGTKKPYSKKDLLENFKRAVKRDNEPKEGVNVNNERNSNVELVKKIHLLPNDKILLGGSFKMCNGTEANNIVCINSDGSLDTTLDFGSGFNDLVSSIANLPDGRILVGGSFDTYNGIPCNRFACLKPDGSLDKFFKIGSGFDAPIYEMVVLPDSRIIVAGAFTQYNGVKCNHIACLLPNGQLDTSFQSGNGFNAPVSALAILPDNRLLAGGFFTKYNNVKRYRLVCLNFDGTINQSFDMGNGFDTSVDFIEKNIEETESPGVFTLYVNISVNTFKVLSNRKVLVGGNFFSYNDVPCYRIACLHV